MGSAVLLVEDDHAMATVIELTLRSAGVEVTTCGRGREGLAELESHPPALVLLDLMLPDIDGLEVCRRIREKSDVPLLMVTARASTADVVAGLEAGADDYLTKPFEAPELLARVRAQLRRGGRDSAGAREAFTVADVVVDPASHRVHKAGDEVALTVTEFALLEELSRHRGHVLSRQQLLELVWGYDHLGDSRVVDMAVQRLRRKIEDDPARPALVMTVRGIGYRMDAP